MSVKDKNLIHKLAQTSLMRDEKTKFLLDRMICKAYNETRNDEEVLIIGALAVKWDLPCKDDIINNIEIEGLPYPF